MSDVDDPSARVARRPPLDPTRAVCSFCIEPAFEAGLESIILMRFYAEACNWTFTGQFGSQFPNASLHGAIRRK